LSSGLKAVESVGATRFGLTMRQTVAESSRRAPSEACGRSVHLELRGNRMGLGTASDAADRDPGQRDRAALREGGTAGAGLILVFAGNCGVRSMSETRKLAAILAADVVGYSRLAGADEDRTLARLRALRSDLIADLPIVNSPRRSPVVSTSLSISSSPAMSPISTTSTSFPEWESLAKSSVAKPSW